MIFMKSIVRSKWHLIVCYKCRWKTIHRSYPSAFWQGITHKCVTYERETNYGV
jgi:hypothetical protein